MAGFGDLLQRITHSLEEAREQQPGDDLRARLGYGTEDVDEDEQVSEAGWEPEAEPGPARTARSAWKPETVRSPKASRAPARAAGTQRAAEAQRAAARDRDSSGRLSASGAPPHPGASSVSMRSERIRARLRTSDALREAFVVKEILDRPLGHRRRR